MPLTSRGTLIPPEEGIAQPSADAFSVVPRRRACCRVLVSTGRRADIARTALDRCQNEALSDYGMCLAHLAAAHAEYGALLAEAQARYPSLARLADG